MNYPNVTRVTCYPVDDFGVFRWHVVAYDGNGGRVVDSSEIWFPVTVDEYAQDRIEDLIEILDVYFPGATIEVSTLPSNVPIHEQPTTAEEVLKAVDNVCQLFSIVSEERLTALRTLEKLAKDYGKNLEDQGARRLRPRFPASRHAREAMTDWQEAKAGVLYPMSFDRATRIDEIESPVLVQSIHIDTRVIFERGQPHALVFPLPAIDPRETVRFTFPADTRFRLHLTQVNTRHA